MKTICFVLPDGAYKPTGGAKVVLEYAKRFAQAGYDVTVGYKIPRENIRKGKIYNALKCCYYGIKYHVFKKYRPSLWFSLPEKVRHMILPINPFRASKKLGSMDFICATAVETAYYVDSIPCSQVTRKLYLIQGFEAWGGVTEQYVFDSYKLPIRKICIAPWLFEKVKSVGEDAKLIPNGFDFTYFSLSEPIEKRNPYHICLLNHNDDDIKRVSDSVMALRIVKEQFLDLYVNMFGIPERPADLPDWFHYYQQPDKVTHNKIYNDSAIFIAASSTEGMALPPAEAMICGCALVCTNIGGFALYAKNGETALTFDVGDVETYAKLISYLISHDEERIRLAKTGNEFINQFTWEKAFDSFKEYVEEKFGV